MAPRKLKAHSPTTAPELLPDNLPSGLRLAPDEDASGVAAFRQRLEAELVPRTVVARLIVDNIVRVELQLRRVDRQVQDLINATACKFFKLAILEAGANIQLETAEELARMAVYGQASDQAQAREKIKEFRVVEAECLARASATVAQDRQNAERESQSLEERRRRLLADLERENQNSARVIEDAEVSDVEP